MSKTKKTILKILIFILTIVSIIIIYFVSKGYSMYKEAVSDFPLTERISKIQSQENFCKLEDVPEIFVNAIVAVEDKRFYIHNGIDILSIGRAIKTDIKDRALTEGGSTITQQISKNLYFTQKKHFTRKIAEMFLAKDLERNYTKKDILEIYININFYGSGYYGIYDASHGYYEKDPSELTDYEATLLAGVPNAPSVYSPKVNLNLAERRQDVVLQKMVEARLYNKKQNE